MQFAESQKWNVEQTGMENGMPHLALNDNSAVCHSKRKICQPQQNSQQQSGAAIKCKDDILPM